MFSPGQKIGPYTLIRELGRGTFGVVWLAEKQDLAKRQLALKIPIIDDPDINDITREARVWVEASAHPNVLAFFEAQVYDGHIVLVSEYAPDGSLADWLKRNGRKAPSVEGAVDKIVGILKGLAHLHALRIIHRDLKPANVLLKAGTPLIADFGLARVLRTSQLTFGVAGTPAYMAPEAWEGNRSEQTDLWSAGVILFEMLAGRRPFVETDGMPLRVAIQQTEPTTLPDDLPASLTSAVNRALKKSPADRYQSATEMLASIQGREEADPFATRPPTPDSNNRVAGKNARAECLGCGNVILLTNYLLECEGIDRESVTVGTILPLQFGCKTCGGVIADYRVTKAEG